MTLKRVLHLIAMTCFLHAVTASAVELHTLYSASIPVADHNTATQDNAIQQGLKIVLIKITGNPGVVTIPNIAHEITQARSLVKTFNYQKQATSHGSPYQLNMTFDQQAISSLLKTNNQATWPSDRPLTFIWISLPGSDDNHILTNNQDDLLTHTVSHLAQDRGLPIILPILDLDDQHIISLDRSQAPTQQALQQLATRYHAQAILSAQATFTNNHFNFNWTFQYNGQSYSWETTGQTAATAIRAGMTQATNLLATQLAVLDNTNLQTHLNITVSNVNNLVDYANLLSYLKSLDIINNLTVNSMDNNTVNLVITLSSGKQNLLNTLSTQHKLSVLNQPLFTTDQKVDLFLQWQQHTANNAQTSSNTKPSSDQQQAKQDAPIPATT